MVEAPERIWAGDFDMGLGHCTAGMRGGLYEEYVRADIAASQLAEARAEYLTASKDAMELAGELNTAEAERDRLAADNARLVKASTYFVDRLKDAWLGKIIRDMDEAEAAFIAALAGKE